MTPSFLEPPKEKFNFFALFVTISLGVAAGNLTSNWITAKIVEYQTKQALIELSKDAERATQESRLRNAAQNAAIQESLRQQRAADLTGKKLAQTCQEWRKADRDLKSYTTRTEVEKNCNRYEKYLSTGQY